MALCHRQHRGERQTFFVADDCHPQTIAVVKTRAEALGVEVVVADATRFDLTKANSLCGALVQTPTSDGRLIDYSEWITRCQATGALAVVATDPLALCIIKPAGEMGADIVVGSAQRFGVPLGFGGPHAAFMACTQKLVRQLPGRIIGISKDAQGKPGLRLALQTREQHIRREKASSNICTAQVLLAVMSAMYAVYHGPKGLRRIATRVHRLTRVLAETLTKLGYTTNDCYFDTLTVTTKDSAAIVKHALERGINLRAYSDGKVGVALDETTTIADVKDVAQAFAASAKTKVADISALCEQLAASDALAVPAAMQRQSAFLTQPVFNSFHSETEMMRYLRRLELCDLALNESMIPLGSCTMKASGATLMEPVSLPGFANIHPFAPEAQSAGYRQLIDETEAMIREITGFSGVSLQPNAGSQGEYTGLLVIRAYHRARGDSNRKVCLIPHSAHGTNPASAAMAGMEVVSVDCDEQGNISLSDLEAKAKIHAASLSAIMVTYPSTHGVFETGIKDLCAITHKYGGLVYMDGANMNALIGLARPAELGADVCHLNLHKSFAIPHGGGGPGVGPIAVAPHLVPFLPGHPVVKTGGAQAIGPVAAAPFGSASVLPISWSYMSLLGKDGLKRATQVAILNANYMAKRLEKHYPVLYRGNGGLVAHEFILDLRAIKDATEVSVDDVAKRLMDFGFHAPTMSWPVPGTLMIEPTESESKAELDRFCEAMITIRQEIAAIERGELKHDESPLAFAPHTAEAVTADRWDRRYPREQAAFPVARLRQHKFWPAVGRVDNVWGDRNFACTWPKDGEGMLTR
jgi:glycine dehydrogenase